MITSLEPRSLSRNKKIVHIRLASSGTATQRLQTLRYLHTIFRLLGYQFTTVSKARQIKYGKYVCLTFDGLDRGIVQTLHPWMKSKSIPATIFIPTAEVQITKRDNTLVTTTPTRLTWQNLRRLSRANWEMASLGHNLIFSTPTSMAAQQEDIKKSRHLITKHIGVAPSSFAYRNGAYDSVTVKCVQDAGFDAAYTLESDFSNSANNSFHIRRSAIEKLDLHGLFHLAASLLKTQTTMSLKKATATPAPMATGDAQ